MDKTAFEGHLKLANEAAGNPSVEDVRKLVTNPEDALEANPSLQPLSVFLTWARDQVPMDWIEEALASREEKDQAEDIQRILKGKLSDLRLKNQLSVEQGTSDETLIRVLAKACKELHLTSSDLAKLQSAEIKTIGHAQWTGVPRREKDDLLMIGVSLYINGREYRKVVKIELKN